MTAHDYVRTIDAGGPMALYNFKTPRPVGRRARRGRTSTSRWNPPESPADEPSKPVRTGFRGYLDPWCVAGTALLMWSLISFFIYVHAGRMSVGVAVLFGGPLVVLALLGVVTPLVWRRQQRRFERVMSGQLEAQEPRAKRPRAEFRRGFARWGLDRARPTGVLGAGRPRGFLASHAGGLGMYLVAVVVGFGGVRSVWIEWIPLSAALMTGFSVAALAFTALLPLHWYRQHRRMNAVAEVSEEESLW